MHDCALGRMRRGPSAPRVEHIYYGWKMPLRGIHSKSSLYIIQFVGFWEKGQYDTAISVLNLRNHIFLKNSLVGYSDFDLKKQNMVIWGVIGEAICQQSQGKLESTWSTTCQNKWPDLLEFLNDIFKVKNNDQICSSI